MPRVVKALPGPSRLSGILAHMRQEPRPTLAAVKKLSLTYASRNDHMGARHFVKEDLPRIRFHNPGVAIEVQPVPNQPKGTVQPTMTIEREDGQTSTIPLAEKWSTTILAELLDVAGTRVWSDWKTKQKAAGLPILENYGKRVIVKPFDPTKPRKVKSSEGKSKRGQTPPVAEEISAEVEADLEKARSGSGARAILP